MKNFTKFLTIAIIGLAFSASTFAQVTASATASATVVTPITITKVNDMNFGNVYVSATVPGTVILSPAGARSFTAGAGLSVPAGTVTAASFTVTGTVGVTYAITLPAGATTIDDNALHTMTVNNWTCSPASPATLTGGTSTLTIGATLNIAAGQATGSYSSDTPFDITVNYN